MENPVDPVEQIQILRVGDEIVDPGDAVLPENIRTRNIVALENNAFNPANQFKPASFKNNKSALEHDDFVTEEIKRLLDLGCVREQPFTPYVINPL